MGPLSPSTQSSPRQARALAAAAVSTWVGGAPKAKLSCAVALPCGICPKARKGVMKGNGTKLQEHHTLPPASMYPTAKKLEDTVSVHLSGEDACPL